MNVIRTEIPDLLILEPRVFEDERGWFMESFNQKVFDEAVGHHVEFVQDNHSFSKRGVLRGLHYQLPPHAQGKLVRVVQGAAWDVAVDLRRTSATYGSWFGIELSDSNRKQLWIPAGFAHGFLTLSNSAHFLYKTDNYYSTEAERSLRWDDQTLAIKWPINGFLPSLSQKDADASPIDRLQTLHVDSKQ
jgi:dTDP-4-dehydrorhamnose 3,5-epimerase